MFIPLFLESRSGGKEVVEERAPGVAVKVWVVKAEKGARRRTVAGAEEARNQRFPFQAEAPRLERAAQLHMVMVEASPTDTHAHSCVAQLTRAQCMALLTSAQVPVSKDMVKLDGSAIGAVECYKFVAVNDVGIVVWMWMGIIVILHDTNIASDNVNGHHHHPCLSTSMAQHA